MCRPMFTDCQDWAKIKLMIIVVSEIVFIPDCYDENPLFLQVTGQNRYVPKIASSVTAT